MMEEYRTSDFGFATFLMTSGVKFLRVEPSPNGDTQRCVFVFRQDTPYVVSGLIMKWSSPEMDFLKAFQYASKRLRTELSAHFNPKSKS